MKAMYRRKSWAGPGPGQGIRGGARARSEEKSAWACSSSSTSRNSPWGSEEDIEGTNRVRLLAG